MRTWAAAMLGHVTCAANARLVSRRRAAKPGSASMRRTAAVKAVGSGATASMNGATSGAAGSVETMGRPCSAQASSEPRRGEAPSTYGNAAMSPDSSCAERSGAASQPVAIT